MTVTIGKVASLSKVTADTLRYYEREGLISPAAKSSGGYHLYDDEAATSSALYQTSAALRFCAHGNAVVVGDMLASGQSRTWAGPRF